MTSFGTIATQNSGGMVTIGNLTVTGPASLEGNASVGGIFSVAGAVALGNTLNVSGATGLTSLTVNNGTSLQGNVSIAGIFSAAGATTFGSTIDVQGVATLAAGGTLTGTFTGGTFASTTLASPTFSGTVAGAGTVPNSVLVNSSTTVAGQTCTLGSGCAIAAANLSNGATGTGAVALATSASLTTPAMSNPTISGLASGAGSNYLCVNTSGGVVTTSPGSVCNSSDERIKTDWGDVPGLSAIMRLHPGSFDWLDAQKANAQGRQIGLRAQDVQRVLPDLVHVGEDETLVLADGSRRRVNGVLSLDYDKLTVPLIVAVQQIQAEIDELKKERR